MAMKNFKDLFFFFFNVGRNQEKTNLPSIMEL